MSFWNLITGRIARWNRVRAEGAAVVRLRLNALAPALARAHPSQAEAIYQSRNTLFAFYITAANYIARSLDGTLIRYRRQLLKVDRQEYLTILCSMHMWQATGEYYLPARTVEDVNWANLMGRGISYIYGREDGYAARWSSKLDLFGESPGGSNHLAIQFYSELAPALRLRPGDVTCAAEWITATKVCREMMRFYLSKEDWNDIVEMELKLTQVTDYFQELYKPPG